MIKRLKHCVLPCKNCNLCMLLLLQLLSLFLQVIFYFYLHCHVLVKVTFNVDEWFKVYATLYIWTQINVLTFYILSGVSWLKRGLINGWLFWVCEKWLTVFQNSSRKVKTLLLFLGLLWWPEFSMDFSMLVPNFSVV